MINVNSIGYALFTALSSDSVLVNSGFNIGFNELLNTQESLMPWAGVNFAGMTLEPKTLGSPTWLANVQFDVFVQDGRYGEMEAAGFDVLTSQYPVLAAINSDFTLGGAVLNLVDLAVSPENVNVEEENLWITNRISLTYQVRG